MRKFMTLAVILAAFTAAPAMADAQFWQATHDFVMKCAVQPYAVFGNETRYSPLRSICKELVVHDQSAMFVLNGETYFATIYDSAHSDGGDLNDLVVMNAAGSFRIERTYIPAFGDVILALAGGDDSFPVVYDPTVSN